MIRQTVSSLALCSVIEVLTGAAYTRHIQSEIMVVSGKIVDSYFKQLPVSPINQPRSVMETLQLLSYATKHSHQSRRHEWALAGLTLPNKAPSHPNWNMIYYKI